MAAMNKADWGTASDDSGGDEYSWLGTAVTVAAMNRKWDFIIIWNLIVLFVTYQFGMNLVPSIDWTWTKIHFGKALDMNRQMNIIQCNIFGPIYSK